MPNPPVERRLEDASELRDDVAVLVQTLRQARETRDDDVFRLVIARFAMHARAKGLPPERLLIVIKRLTMGEALGHLPYWRRNALKDRAVRWSIQAYYR